MTRPTLILDTNVFVAAGFRAKSASGRLLDAVRAGAYRHVWHDRTLSETRHILSRVPRLSWTAVSGLFGDDGRVDGDLPDELFAIIGDPHDRKYAALASVSGAWVISGDRDLLGVRDFLSVTVLRPNEFLKRTMGDAP